MPNKEACSEGFWGFYTWLAYIIFDEFWRQCQWGRPEPDGLSSEEDSACSASGETFPPAPGAGDLTSCVEELMADFSRGSRRSVSVTL